MLGSPLAFLVLRCSSLSSSPWIILSLRFCLCVLSSLVLFCSLFSVMILCALVAFCFLSPRLPAAQHPHRHRPHRFRKSFRERGKKGTAQNPERDKNSYPQDSSCLDSIFESFVFSHDVFAVSVDCHLSFSQCSEAASLF